MRAALFASMLAVAHGTVSTKFTCAPGAPESTLPFCNRKLGFQARSADLVSRLNVTEKLDLWGHSYPSSHTVDRFNTKSWSLDHTCIHGVNGQHGVTVFAHAIAQGASFDLDLVARISNATAVEARIMSWQKYYGSGGSTQGAVLSCDGGPLANSAHDPRWGRISETYGEDPLLIKLMGVKVLRALQNQQRVPGSVDEDYFMATRQVVRHYLGYHSARPDLGPENAIMNVTERSLADSYLPTYESFMSTQPGEGNADGIMCSMASVNGVPACANPYLLKTVLRDQWKSDALVQTDCCDSIKVINNPFHYNGTTNNTEALRLSVEAGVQVYYGFSGGEFTPDFAGLLTNGTIAMEKLDSAATRVIKSQMKLGFFDSAAEDFPFSNASIPWEMLDSAEHRALARESAAKSTVVLTNNGILPLKAGVKVAVIGPFANCTVCMLHSYNGYPSQYTTILQGIAAKTSATYSLGSNATCDKKGDECWTKAGDPSQAAIAAAVAVAKEAEVTVLVIGLGAGWEAEGEDRVNVSTPALQAALQSAVAAVSKKLVIVCMSAGGVDVDDSSADASVYAPYGGEEGGSGLADVLFGDVNPSAKLPVTVYKQAWADAMNVNYNTSIGIFDLEVGLGRTHRYVQADQVKYGFGFGLSYTTFAYSNLTVVKNTSSDVVADIFVTLKNTGTIAGADVVQAYSSVPTMAGVSTPKQNMVAFSKVMLQPQESQVVHLQVSSASIAVADDEGKMHLSSAAYTFSVGGHQPGAKGTSGDVQVATVNLNFTAI